MAAQLPFVPSIGSYRVATVLDDETYIFDVRWNSRTAAWYFDLRDIDENPIIMGVKVVLGAYLARTATHPLLANGVIVALDLSGEEREATFDDLGVRVIVVRHTGSEAAAEIVGE